MARLFPKPGAKRHTLHPPSHAVSSCDHGPAPSAQPEIMAWTYASATNQIAILEQNRAMRRTTQSPIRKPIDLSTFPNGRERTDASAILWSILCPGTSSMEDRVGAPNRSRTLCRMTGPDIRLSWGIPKRSQMPKHGMAPGQMVEGRNQIPFPLSRLAQLTNL